MIIGPRRLALIGAIVAVALAIIFYPLIVRTPIDLDKVSIELTKVALKPSTASEEELSLELTLTLTNLNNFTLTTSRIEYELFADGASIGTSVLSYESVPVNGRPALFPGDSIPLRHLFLYKYSDSGAETFSKIMSNSTQIDWSIRGSAFIESATTLETKQFSDEL
ncbi:MAG: hypothetical protein ACREBU_04075 [Nitrososphaera sp.]